MLTCASQSGRSGGRPVLRQGSLDAVDAEFVETLIDFARTPARRWAGTPPYWIRRGTKLCRGVPATTQTQKPARPETPARGEKPAPTLSREKAVRLAQGRRSTRAGNPHRHEWRGFVGMT